MSWSQRLPVGPLETSILVMLRLRLLVSLVRGFREKEASAFRSARGSCVGVGWR